MVVPRGLAASARRRLWGRHLVEVRRTGAAGERRAAGRSSVKVTRFGKFPGLEIFAGKEKEGGLTDDILPGRAVRRPEGQLGEALPILLVEPDQPVQLVLDVVNLEEKDLLTTVPPARRARPRLAGASLLTLYDTGKSGKKIATCWPPCLTCRSVFTILEARLCLES